MDKRLDLLCITESWLPKRESTALMELIPPDCSSVTTPRELGHGGGLLTVFKSSLNCEQFSPVSSLVSFELSAFELASLPTLQCVVIDCLPKQNSNFIEEFATLLAEIALTMRGSSLLLTIRSMSIVLANLWFETWIYWTPLD